MRKYLKLFELVSEYEEAIESGMELPNISYVKENKTTYYNPLIRKGYERFYDLDSEQFFTNSGEEFIVKF
jgi:hypothetical protein